MFPAAGSQSSLYGPLGFGEVSFGPQSFASQPLSDAPLATGERSPQDEFKQHIHVVLQQLARVQGVARNVLAGV
jgi:hypothetical protein